ncbi:hypothetical protein G9A89_020694 [Geosiphon pyriformis]|nr:hypothetical protein G9A89_020694 [Geosiphon pyriformis]
MGVCCDDDKEYTSAIKFYCYLCIIECFGRPKWIGKWDNESCLAYGCPHNDDEIWQMTLTKIEGATPEEIKTIKNNPLEPIELDWDPEPVINFLDPKQFYEHYQKLAPIREEQE